VVTGLEHPRYTHEGNRYAKRRWYATVTEYKTVTMQPESAERKKREIDADVAPRRWGRLQEAVLYGILDGHNTMRAIAALYCWDSPPTRSQLGSLRRAARSVAKHVGHGVWRLKDGL
jgi:hypothetical protein